MPNKDLDNSMCHEDAQEPRDKICTAPKIKSDSTIQPNSKNEAHLSQLFDLATEALQTGRHEHALALFEQFIRDSNPNKEMLNHHDWAAMLAREYNPRSKVKKNKRHHSVTSKNQEDNNDPKVWVYLPSKDIVENNAFLYTEEFYSLGCETFADWTSKIGYEPYSRVIRSMPLIWSFVRNLGKSVNDNSNYPYMDASIRTGVEYSSAFILCSRFSSLHVQLILIASHGFSDIAKRMESDHEFMDHIYRTPEELIWDDVSAREDCLTSIKAMAAPYEWLNYATETVSQTIINFKDKTLDSHFHSHIKAIQEQMENKPMAVDNWGHAIATTGYDKHITDNIKQYQLSSQYRFQYRFMAANAFSKHFELKNGRLYPKNRIDTVTPMELHTEIIEQAINQCKNEIEEFIKLKWDQGIAEMNERFESEINTVKAMINDEHELIQSIRQTQLLEIREKMRAEASKRQYQVHIQKLENLKAAFGFLSLGLSMVGKQEIAQKISVFGTSMVTMIDSTYKITQSIRNSIVGFSLSPYLGIFHAICSIITLFDKKTDMSDPGWIKVLESGLKHVSKQIENLSLEMNKRFDKIESMLLTSHRTILHGIISLHNKMDDLKEEIKALNEKIIAQYNNVQDSINKILVYVIDYYMQISSQLANAEFSHLMDTLFILEDHLDVYGELKQFREAFIELSHIARRRSNDDMFTNTLRGEMTDKRIVELLKIGHKFPEVLEAVTHSIFSINLLKRYATERLGFNENSSPLPNPEIWVKSTSILIKLVQSKSSQKQPKDLLNVEEMNILKEIESEGKRLIKFIDWIGAPTIVEKLIDNYERSLTSILRSVQTLIKKSEDKFKSEMSQHYKKNVEDDRLLSISNKLFCDMPSNPTDSSNLFKLDPHYRTQDGSAYRKAHLDRGSNNVEWMFFGIHDGYQVHLSLPYKQFYECFPRGTSIPECSQWPRTQPELANEFLNFNPENYLKDRQVICQQNFNDIIRMLEHQNNDFKTQSYPLFDDPMDSITLNKGIVCPLLKDEFHLLALPTPEAGLKISATLHHAERLGLGRIMHAYQYTNDRKNILVKTFLANSTKEVPLTCEKIRALDLYKVSEKELPFSENIITTMERPISKKKLEFYSFNESLIYFWNGGSYAANPNQVVEFYFDGLQWSNVQNGLTPHLLFARRNMQYDPWRDKINNAKELLSGEELDTINRNLDFDINNKLIARRVDFNNDLFRSHFRFSSADKNSEMHEMLQNLDAHYYLLDAYLGLAFAEEYLSKSPFTFLHDPSLMKTSDDILRFMNHYRGSTIYIDRKVNDTIDLLRQVKENLLEQISEREYVAKYKKVKETLSTLGNLIAEHETPQISSATKLMPWSQLITQGASTLISYIPKTIGDAWNYIKGSTSQIHQVNHVTTSSHSIATENMGNSASNQDNMYDPHHNNKHNERHREIPRSTFLQQQSIHDQLISVQYGIHYLQKWSLFTFPWNKKKSLSSVEKQSLMAQQTILVKLSNEFNRSKNKRAYKHHINQDNYSDVSYLLHKTSIQIKECLEKNAYTTALRDEIKQNISRLEKKIPTLTNRNIEKALRRSEIAQARQMRRQGKETPKDRLVTSNQCAAFNKSELLYLWGQETSSRIPLLNNRSISNERSLFIP